jgi:pimeloyl-ACP methyl ester carboxylesterase
MRMQYQSLTITLPLSEMTLHIKQSGSGNETCILHHLHHGFGEGAYVWDSFAASVAKLFRTLAIDLRGHGDSSWHPKGEYGVECHIADLLEVIDALRLDRLVLVGHSLGGEIAIRIAAARPESVIGLVVVDFGPDLDPDGSARVLTDFNDSVRTWGSLSEYREWLRQRRPLVGSALISDLSSARCGQTHMEVIVLADNSVLSANFSTRLLEILAQTRTFPDRLKAGVSPGWRLCHKTGTSETYKGLTTASHDVGVLTAPDGEMIAVVVLIGDSRARAEDRATMTADVARAVISSYR